MVFVCMCPCEDICTWCNCLNWGWKRVLGLLELELLMIVSYWTRVLGTQLQSSGRAAHTFNHWPIPPVPWFTFLSEGILSCFMLAIECRARIPRGSKAVLTWRCVGQWESKFLLLSTETWAQHLGLCNETSSTDYEDNRQSLVLKV